MYASKNLSTTKEAVSSMSTTPTNSGELKFLLIIATKFSNNPGFRGFSAAVLITGFNVVPDSLGRGTDFDISNVQSLTFKLLSRICIVTASYSLSIVLFPGKHLS